MKGNIYHFTNCPEAFNYLRVTYLSYFSHTLLTIFMRMRLSLKPLKFRALGWFMCVLVAINIEVA